jgi:hypothetical protein
MINNFTISVTTWHLLISWHEICSILLWGICLCYTRALIFKLGPILNPKVRSIMESFGPQVSYTWILMQIYFSSKNGLYIRSTILLINTSFLEEWVYNRIQVQETCSPIHPLMELIFKLNIEPLLGDWFLKWVFLGRDRQDLTWDRCHMSIAS